MCLRCIDWRCLLASSFSLGDFIYQVLVSSSRTVFAFRPNTNQAMSTWPAVLRSSAIAKGSVWLFISLSRMNFAKSKLVKLFRFFTRTREDSASADFLFWDRQHQILQLTFWFFERQLSKALVDGFHCKLPLGHFYRHTCLQTDSNYACH